MLLDRYAKALGIEGGGIADEELVDVDWTLADQGIRDQMKYRLRTLLIAAAIGPPMMAWAWINLQYTVPLGIWPAVKCLVVWRTERRAAKRRG